MVISETGEGSLLVSFATFSISSCEAVRISSNAVMISPSTVSIDACCSSEIPSSPAAAASASASAIRTFFMFSRKDSSKVATSKTTSASSSVTISTLIPLTDEPVSAMDFISSCETSSSLLDENAFPSPAPRSFSTETTVPSAFTLTAFILTFPSRTALLVWT